MMKNIYQITIAHSRYDSRIFHRISKSLAKTKLNLKLIVSDGLGYEKKDNLIIKDIGNYNKLFFKNIFKQIKIFFELKNKNSIIHFHEPILLPLAIFLRIFGNIVIFDMHENIHLQIMTKNWPLPNIIKKIISKFYRKIENQFLRGLNGITVPQPIMVDIYKKYNKNIISISNFYTNEKDNNSKNILKLKSYKDLIYSGTVSKERGFFNMINLMASLPKEYKLHIAGNVNNELKKKIPDSLKNNIILYGYLDLNELKKLYRKCGIGLIMFNNIGQYYMSYSLKLFEYMHYGMFIIMPNFGEWLIFNKDYKVGLNLDPKDSRNSSNTLKNLDINSLNVFSERNFSNVRKFFIWENEVVKLIDFYKKLSKY